MNDRIEKVLLYKCLVCGQIFKCWFNGIYSCLGCLRNPKDCPKSLPHTLKDISSGLCPACQEKKTKLGFGGDAERKNYNIVDGKLVLIEGVGRYSKNT